MQFVSSQETCCSVLNRLEALQRALWKASKQTVAEIQSGGDKRMDELLCCLHGKKKSDLSDASEVYVGRLADTRNMFF